MRLLTKFIIMKWIKTENRDPKKHFNYFKRWKKNLKI